MQMAHTRNKGEPASKQVKNKGEPTSIQGRRNQDLRKCLGVAQNKNTIHSERLAKENRQDNTKVSSAEPEKIPKQYCAVGYPWLNHGQKFLKVLHPLRYLRAREISYTTEFWVKRAGLNCKLWHSLTVWLGKAIALNFSFLFYEREIKPISHGHSKD